MKPYNVNVYVIPLKDDSFEWHAFVLSSNQEFNEDSIYLTDLGYISPEELDFTKARQVTTIYDLPETIDDFYWSDYLPYIACDSISYELHDWSVIDFLKE